MAAVLVLDTPDDGRLRPKHVEWPCRNKTCTVSHQVGVSFDLHYDARKHKIKMYVLYVCIHVCMHACMHACMYACMYASLAPVPMHLFMLPVRCSHLLYFDRAVGCRRWDLASSQSLQTNAGMTSPFFWDVTRRSLIDIYRRFAATYLSDLTLEGRAR